MSETVVPVQFAEGAEERVAELGMQDELQAMLDWVRQNVRGLAGIRLGLSYPHGYLGGKRGVILWAHQQLPYEEAVHDMIEIEWGKWKAQTFPPRVCTNFVMICTSLPLPADALER